MAGEAPVYRSSRLHAVNPTAAVSEDTSYLYTLVGAGTLLSLFLSLLWLPVHAGGRVSLAFAAGARLLQAGWCPQLVSDAAGGHHRRVG